MATIDQSWPKNEYFSIRILLATDGSEVATLTARTAIDVADKIDSELHLVLAGLSGSYVGMGPLDIADITSPTHEELNHKAQRLLNAQLIEANEDIAAEAHLRIGQADEEIVSQVENTGRRSLCLWEPRTQQCTGTPNARSWTCAKRDNDYPQTLVIGTLLLDVGAGTYPLLRLERLRTKRHLVPEAKPR